jgi:PAS domain S-box-containing protein
MIIEDEEPHFQLMRRAILKDFPSASVLHSVDALECLNKIDEIRPDVIFADYRMPGMNGIEFVRVLGDRDESIPVIIVTGQGDEQIAAQAIKSGAWDYLTKSADSMTLIPRILEKVVAERRLRSSLREAERRFQNLAESTLTWIWDMDPEGLYTYSNSVVEKVLGYGADEVVGRHFHDFFPARDKEDQKQTLLQMTDGGKPVAGLVSRMVSQNGQEVVMETDGAPILDKAGNLLGFRGMSRNITRRKMAEEHIRLLTRQSLRAQESERLKLSRDLHDTIGQDLSTLKIGIDTLLDDEPGVSQKVREKVLRFSKMLQETITAVRNLAYDLRPATLDQFGLVRTIHQYCQEFSERNSIQVDFLSAGLDDLDLGFDTRITLFRLVQEGLNNVRKHARASRVSLRLVASFPKIILNLEDDGKGFDVQQRLKSTLSERCMGLCSMEERVALLGGTMKLDSRPLKGTRVRVEVPLREKRDEIEENRSHR